MYAVHLTKDLFRHFPNLGILVHGENGFRFRIVTENFLQGLIDMAHRCPQVFPAMGRHEDQLMIAPDGRFQFRIVEIKDILYSLFKGIDDRISRYINGIFRDIFL